MQLIDGSGGDPDRGVQLPKLIHDAGFELIAVDGDLDVWWSPETKARMMRAARDLWEHGESGRRAVEQGLMTAEQIQSVLETVQGVVDQPSAWSAGPWFSAVGRKSHGCRSQIASRGLG
jgi:hypothetical protein